MVSNVNGVPSGTGVISRGGFFRPRIVVSTSVGGEPRPAASQTGVHTSALVPVEWKSRLHAANRRRCLRNRDIANRVPTARHQTRT